MSAVPKWMIVRLMTTNLLNRKQRHCDPVGRWRMEIDIRDERDHDSTVPNAASHIVVEKRRWRLKQSVEIGFDRRR